MDYVWTPRAIEVDKIYTADLGEPLEHFEFYNPGPHYITARFDLASNYLPDRPHVLLRPGATAARTLRTGREAFSFMAVSEYGSSGRATEQRFEFQASNEVISSSPASYSEVGVGEVSSTTTNQVVNESATAGEAWAQWRVQGDPFLRGFFDNLGNLFAGGGSAAPPQQWKINADNIEFLREVLFSTGATFYRPNGDGTRWRFIPTTGAGGEKLGLFRINPSTGALELVLTVTPDGQIQVAAAQAPSTDSSLVARAYVDSRTTTPAWRNAVLVSPYTGAVRYRKLPNGLVVFDGEVIFNTASENTPMFKVDADCIIDATTVRRYNVASSAITVAPVNLAVVERGSLAEGEIRMRLKNAQAGCHLNMLAYMAVP